MNRKGFTLLELLIVIAILAVLATVAVLVINPLEYLKQSRDAKRIGDMAVLNKALGLAEFENVSLGGASTTVFVSLVDIVDTCTNLALPVLPTGYQYHCVTVAADLRKVDGNGWIPVNLTNIPAKSPLAALPLDPTNDTTKFYTYIPGGSFGLSATLESDKYLKQNAAKDGGTNPAKIESGSDLKLLTNADGLVGYWPFDEGSGIVAADMSGKGHPGNIESGSPTWTTGKVGGALNFSGNGVVRATSAGAGSFAKGHTFTAWFNPSALVAGNNIFASFSSSFPYMGTYATGNNPVHSALGSSQSWIQGSGTISINNWYFIVGTYDGINIKIYVNGILAGTAAGAGAESVGPDLCIGALACVAGSYLTTGKVDEIRMYNRPFLAAEIKAMYDATK